MLGQAAMNGPGRQHLLSVRRELRRPRRQITHEVYVITEPERKQFDIIGVERAPIGRLLQTARGPARGTGRCQRIGADLFRQLVPTDPGNRRPNS